MQLAKEIKNELRESRKLRLSLRGKLYWGGACLVIIWLFDHFGSLDLALPTLNCIAVLGFIIYLKWKFRRSAWFWVAMTIIAGLHVLLLVFVPWTTHWVPALAIAAVDSVDFTVILAILTAVGNFVERSKTAER